jgi:methionyl-tRNA synthetase
VVGCAVEDEPLRQEALGLCHQLDPAMQTFNFAAALETIFHLVNGANRYIETQAPWQLAKAAHLSRLQAVLAVLAEVIRIVAIALEPVMPLVSTSIWNQLGLGDGPRRLADASRWPGIVSGQPLGKRVVLFPKTA